ncbi:DUF2878 domain-containing protein [Novipirellula sp. SH528]|uniref:DUF2878 domain-containing protein n=1 Tax=Novipirellula sp. SH528 TaxID=3454466 RepID=UPI003FA0088C
MPQYVNFLLYQTGWFAIVVSAAHSKPWWGITIAMSLVAVHMLLTSERTNQAKMLLIATGVGLVVDSTLLGLEVYHFPNESAIGMLPPLWMSALWIQFATTFRYCLKWLSGRYVLSALLAFVGAPLAFAGGENIGAVSFYSPRLSNLLVLGSLWAIAIPLLIYISDRIQADASVAATYRGFPSPEKV